MRGKLHMKIIKGMIKKLFGKKPKKGFFKMFYIGSICIYIYEIVVKLVLIVQMLIVNKIIKINDIVFLLIILIIFPLLIKGILKATYFSNYNE